MNQHQTMLREYVARFTARIDDQAQTLLERHCAAMLPSLAGGLAAFGIPEPPAVRFVEVWEDREHGQLPPKIVGEMDVSHAGGRTRARFDVPVGAFHDNAKDDQIFEMCMLRAEAQQELAGQGDGHALDRMRELEQMIVEGRVVFDP